MTRSAAQRSVPDEDQPMSNGCPQVQALKELATEIKLTREAFAPAANAIADLGGAQKKFCKFLLKNRMKITAGLFGALVALGVISPNLAVIIGKALHAAGAM